MKLSTSLLVLVGVSLFIEESWSVRSGLRKTGIKRRGGGGGGGGGRRGGGQRRRNRTTAAPSKKC